MNRLTTAFGSNLKESKPLEPKFKDSSAVPAHLEGFEKAGMGRFVTLKEGVKGDEAVGLIKKHLGLEHGKYLIRVILQPDSRSKLTMDSGNSAIW